MSGARPWAFYAVVLALALAVGLAVRAPSPEQAGAASLESAGPLGLKVLATWLAESGHPVTALEAPLREVPAGTATVVFPAATARQLIPEEVSVLERFAEGGGTVVVLLPLQVNQQPALRTWLQLEAGTAAPLSLELRRLDDPAGASVGVKLQGGPTAAVARLRVAAEGGVRCTAPGAVEVAEAGALSYWPRGRGGVWVASRTLAENRRLELDDNARLWANFAAAGPMAFLEGHQTAASSEPVSTHLQPLLLQALLVALAFVLAVAPRMGPPRPTPSEVDRPLSDSVRALARLTARAGVEPQLALALRQRLRQLFQERLGIPAALPAEEAARALAVATGQPPETWVAFERATDAAQAACTPQQLLALVRTAAQLEALSAGRGPRCR